MNREDVSNHAPCRPPRPCGRCRQPTVWIEISFEIFLCPGACTDAMWREYIEAERGRSA